MVENSNIVKNGKLVSYDNWSEYIDSLKKEVSKTKIIKNEKEAVELLKPKFLEAVKSRIPTKRFGIFFSGGVDSTLIASTCKKFTDDFVCYTVGIEGSQDIEWSTKIAKDLKLKHAKKILTLKEMEILFKKIASLLEGDTFNIVNLGVGSVVFAAIELAEKDKINTFFGGLGSEEIFAGYKRHEDSIDINEECWQGLKTTWTRDFQRDYTIAINKKSTFLTPFLDKHLVIEAMKISVVLKINQGHKK
ncbi:MAG: asparagine synthase-related protein, partial [Nanoarchaeota archaeon]